jgi:hypothetical protein
MSNTLMVELLRRSLEEERCKPRPMTMLSMGLESKKIWDKAMKEAYFREISTEWQPISELGSGTTKKNRT